jgi:hypothetical protein
LHRVKDGKRENVGRMELEYNNELLKKIFDILLAQRFVPHLIVIKGSKNIEIIDKLPPSWRKQ